MSTIPLANFTKGEISPELQARIDTNQYEAGAKQVRNFIIQRYGGLAFRPGFRMVAEVDDITKTIRYIPFQFNIEQAYVLALEDYSMRLLAVGGLVLEQGLKILSVSNEANAMVEAAYHDYDVGDRVFFQNVGGMPQLNGRSAYVTAVVDASHFRIDIDTTGFGGFTTSNGDTRTAPPTPPAPPPPPPPDPPPPPPPPDTGGGAGGYGTDYGTGSGGSGGNGAEGFHYYKQSTL